MAASRRRPRLDEPAVLRVRVTLEHSDPPIVRVLDLRSDLRLDQVHEVLQVAFGWADSHLHRFALGESVFDDTSEKFLCSFDVEEQDDGVPETTVHLDETLSRPGDVLRYCYDYGDDWSLDLVLEDVQALDRVSVSARCVAAERAAPPEDCGSRRTAEELAGVLADPAHVDVHDINEVLGSPLARLVTGPFTPDLVAALLPLTGSLPDRIVPGLLAQLDEPAPLDRAEKERALSTIRWFLERIGADGLAMTAAGWLRPEDVVAASEMVPDGPDWIGKKNREIDTVPVHQFRLMLADLGLTRKYEGRLRLSKSGAAAYDDPDRLWRLLAGALPPGKTRTFARQAGLLVLAQIAATGVSDTDAVARALTNLGWRTSDGRRVDGFQAYDATRAVHAALASLDPSRHRRMRRPEDSFGPAGRQLAFEALLDLH
ncbi:plasmid pRiA4b ORF-3 family protein [Nocardioides sp. HDW12B]|uniref:plasmid pRiA4b ORF-3 family protein n=1 Tax=Nocardioides sp. HDW12B TaxID=2714939 RepID=UPI00140AF5EA|nr:plasmid pRiA4b ORF-3 family protein [Nocardioides sp. HDW12B]QIK67302.1 plasmid pRiA4b ORF-3 family protein [Nocardioides sp. HDW12B]